MMFWGVGSLIVLVLGLGGVAFTTLLERKFLGMSQTRLGPNKVTLSGILQPVADGIKLLFKQMFLMNYSQSFLFVISPSILLWLFFMLWLVVMPWTGLIIQMKYSSLILFAFLGVGAYSIILTGWSSMSKFSKLGSLRGILQSLSYEVALILIFMFILILGKTFSLGSSLPSLWEMLFAWLAIWLTLSLMESNRAPFDLLEGESELISGFNIEMGSLTFVFLFLSEYGMIIVMALVASLAMKGHLSEESLLFVAVLLFMRSCFPRIRYDVLMSSMWQSFLPVSVVLALLVFF